MKIVVLGGGISTERQVSLVTSTSVCGALRSRGHRAVFVDMFLGLRTQPKELESLFDAEDGLCGHVEIGHSAPDLDEVRALRGGDGKSRLGEGVLDICRLADCVFLGLHGLDGEDGKIQATLDLLGVPYTGSSPLGSAIALDKEMAREIMQFNGIAAAPLTEVPPCVVKCVHGGSSIGTYLCDTQAELQQALVEARRYQDDIIIERKIEGTELTVPVLDGRALSPIEIVPPQGGSFDYVAKYQSGAEGAREICPARISDEKTRELQAIAEKLHRAMKLSVYSRADFIMDRHGKVWCLEVNTLPGMTPNSLIPKAAAFAGMDYPTLCERIVELSLEVRR
ncbi:MAG: D-alanine--D-alanine ligase [Fretibacterium sp.]|nr:D-alanine--D-alanine ligase [Fretibacterium sp.]